MRMGERETDRWVYICAYISYHVPGEGKYNDRDRLTFISILYVNIFAWIYVHNNIAYIL